MNNTVTESHVDAIRRTMSNHHVMRRDELFLALPLDIDTMDASINEMMSRGEMLQTRLILSAPRDCHRSILPVFHLLSCIRLF